MQNEQAPRRAIAAIAAGALALRLIHLASLRGTPLFAVLIGDAKQDHAWAVDIASGHWIGSQVFYQTPPDPSLLEQYDESVAPQ